MNTTEDRARAAMRAIAGTVNDAPPLPLGRSHAGARTRRPRWRPWIAPLAAAIAVIAIAVTLVVLRGTPHPRPVTPLPPRPVPSPTVPRYYVAVNQPGEYSPASLVVADSRTGVKLATIEPLPGTTFTGVTGAADDRTFVVESQPDDLGEENEPWQPRTWYLLRIAPGATATVELHSLPIPRTPAGSGVDAIALSPDGKELAVAIQPDAVNRPGAPVYLRLYSVATGAMLRSWSTTDVTAVFGGPKYSGPDRDTVITWLDDGHTLAFGSSWTTGLPKQADGSDVQPTAAQRKNIRHYVTIRTLNTAGPAGNLLADSRVVWSAVSDPDEPSARLSCQSELIPLVAADGKVVVCGATAVLHSPGAKITACPAIPPWKDMGFLGYSTSTGKLADVLARYPVRCATINAAIYPLRVSDSGDAVLGYLDVGHSGTLSQTHPGAQFGVFSHGTFTPLPYPLIDTGLLINYIAW